MIAHGSGLLLRPFQEGDQQAMVRYGNDAAVWRNLTSRFPHPYTLEAADNWIRIANENPADTRNLAIVVDGEAIGAVGFERQGDLHTRTAEIGYWIGQPFWGRGLATAALRLATEIAFEHFDFVRLQAGIIDWNAASCRVVEKAGYVFEARLRRHIFKDGQISDLLLYVRLRE
jgi:ribosomal-protein-alanine N-acetyltransferase